MIDWLAYKGWTEVAPEWINSPAQEEKRNTQGEGTEK